MSKKEMQLNGTMLQGFSWNLPSDGQHWRRLGQMASGFVEKGITSVWLPPAYKGTQGQNDVGYGVYDLWDLGEFDQRGSVPTKYGTRRELNSAVVAMHEAGIDVLGDFVLNHRLGADATEQVKARPVAADNRLYDLGDLETIEAWTAFTFPGRNGEYDDFTWDWHCFKGTDYNQATGSNGIWLFDGKGWDSDVSQEMGNFDYLMGADVDFNNPDVYEQLVKWGVWFVDEVGLDGLRLDAIKHMSRDFYRRWLKDVRAKVDHELFVVGEYWAFTSGELCNYAGDQPVMNLFDVPLHFAFYRASVDREHIDFSHILDEAYVSVDPVHAVTFVDNHDTQPNQSLASTVEHWFKPVAYSIILLREAGYPCVFFADLYGLPNDAIPAVAELPLLMEIRKRYSYGAQHDYLDESDLAGWTREGDADMDESGLAVVLCNRAFPEEQPPEPVDQPEQPQDEQGEGGASADAGDGESQDVTQDNGDASTDAIAVEQDSTSEQAGVAEGDGDTDPEPVAEPEPSDPGLPDGWPAKEMYVGSQHAGETWRCVLGNHREVLIDDEGVGRFPASKASMTAVYLPAGAADRLNRIPIVMD